eukprot:CAMPEP_0173407976 /NCGR_PEP_ID=MMETSP1356-20130122/68527_1 /TAXON_ID=77927 ORGANISM="Hemiselmis virescens, Strain PCC157" /NCGR_SAMPLE_ID=MMETSP1356 /ASSEMBLY_ACC=CAM_ASM_000847 /LENGTH=462 /DNA_ID=CAMNT_0014369211 /DNA_START=164 /DNA_END=1549 /DNA_ORIENTATION=-
MPPSKVRIERIEGNRMRQNTFHKRKLGLIKKAIELTVLTDCDCAIILRSGATTTCKEGRLMAYCNKDIATMLAECQPTLSTIQHFTNNEYARFSKDKDAISQVSQAITERAKKPANKNLQPSPASIHEQAMAAISLEDEDEGSDELSCANDETIELKKKLSQLEAELARLRTSSSASSSQESSAHRRRASESARRPLPPPIATNWAAGPSASAPAGSKRMLSPGIIAPLLPTSASYTRSPTQNAAILSPDELITGGGTPKGAAYGGLPQFKKIRQGGSSPESWVPLDTKPQPNTDAFATLDSKQQRSINAPPPPVPFSPSGAFASQHGGFGGMPPLPQQPRSNERNNHDAMMLLCSPNAASMPFDKSPMHRGLSGLSPRVLLQPPSTTAYQPTARGMSARGMSMDIQAIFGAQAAAANSQQFTDWQRMNDGWTTTKQPPTYGSQQGVSYGLTPTSAGLYGGP